jgi:hypothetical protein
MCGGSLNLAVNVVADIGTQSPAGGGLGVHRNRLGLSIMAVTEHNCMRQHDSRDMYMVSLLTHHSELAGAYGKMDGMKSLCSGSVLKSGV